MKIDLTHYANKLKKTMDLLVHVEHESPLHDGVVLLSLEGIKPYLDLVHAVIIGFSDKKYDEKLVNQIIAESEITKTKLSKIYEPRIKFFGDIREVFVKIVHHLTEVDKYKGKEGKEGFVVALMGLVLVLLSSQDIEALPSGKDKQLLLKISNELKKIDFKNLTDDSKHEFLNLKDQVNKIADRYHLHYLEVSELSKMHPSLILGSDHSFSAIAESVREETFAAPSTLDKITKVKKD